MATRTARKRPKSTATQTSVITKHNGAKQALPESEDRYRALFDHSPDAVYIHDLEGNFLDANDAALRLLGYTRDEIRELSFADLLDVPQFPTALAVLQEIMESGYQAKPTVFKLKRKDETLVEVETVAAIITSEGQPVAIQGIARDITERRQAEKALRKAHDALERRAEETLQKSEGRYHALLQAAPDAIVVANGDGRITEVNRQTEMMFGYGRDELVDAPVELLIPKRLRQAHVGHRMAYAASPHTRAMGAYPDQLTGRRKDGSEFSIDVALSAVKTGEGALTMAVIRDITERKRLEKELQQAREELEGWVERKLLQKNPYRLTFREFTVLHHVASGKADKQIAHELGISPLTVHKHVANILAKMNAASRTEAGVRALREGLVD